MSIFEKVGFLFRELRDHDHGIDAEAEPVEGGQATSQLIRLQVKAGPSFFRERAETGFVFRFDDKHHRYWMNHALPVVLLLCDLDHGKVYWQEVSEQTVVSTGKGWKVVVPRRQIVDASSRAALVRLAARKSTESELEETPTELEELYEKRAEALACGDDTSHLDAEILAIKRRNRAGGNLHTGDLLAGRYKLRGVLGAGGFATVWQAYDKKARCVVAVKALHAQYAKDKTRRDRFFRGARLMAELEHPGIVRVLEQQLDDDGHHFFVMEHLSGGDLHKAVLAKKVAREQAIELVRKAGEALAYAHSKGVIHRDVKPANILLAGDGQPKLTDFDLVRAQDTTGGTRTGAMGTFVYAAPEQLEDAKAADERADVFGLGMTLVFALYRKKLPPKVLRDPDSVVDDLRCSMAIKGALKKAVDWELEQRWGSVDAFLAALPWPPAVQQPEPRSRVRVAAAGEPAVIATAGVAPEAGAVKEGPFGMRFRFIPAGTYTAGSPQDEPGRRSQEWPQHPVQLTRGFWLAETPVTQAQWCRLVSRNPSEFQKDAENRPVEQVSWLDAVAFANLLSQQAGFRPCYKLTERHGEIGKDLECDSVEILDSWVGGFRLPTEAEWEIAARAGTKTAVYTGGLTLEGEKGERAEELDAIAWYSGNTGYGTEPVKQKLANAWGLHDMLGNVWEWCWDLPGHAETEQLRVDPRGGSQGSDRVVRGGSWFGRARDVRAAYRDWHHPGSRSLNLGVRLAQDQEQPAGPEAQPAPGQDGEAVARAR